MQWKKTCAAQQVNNNRIGNLVRGLREEPASSIQRKTQTSVGPKLQLFTFYLLARKFYARPFHTVAIPVRIAVADSRGYSTVAGESLNYPLFESPVGIGASSLTCARGADFLQALARSIQQSQTPRIIHIKRMSVG